MANLCRYCEVPTEETDNPLADYPLKTTAKSAKMISRNDDEGLQALSQHKIENTMYKIQLHSHSKQGIHGACPIELLHAMYLGIMKYTCDHLFEQMGKESKLAGYVNGLSMLYGELLSRQSDHDLPVTKFSNGIRKGKIMAQEYPGILLCMAAVF